MSSSAGDYGAALVCIMHDTCITAVLPPYVYPLAPNHLIVSDDAVSRKPTEPATTVPPASTMVTGHMYEPADDAYAWPAGSVHSTSSVFSVPAARVTGEVPGEHRRAIVMHQTQLSDHHQQQHGVATSTHSRRR